MLKSKISPQKKVHPDILRHIEWLERETAGTLAQVKIIGAEMDCVKARLKEFLEGYFGEVGKYFGDLERINQDIDRKYYRRRGGASNQQFSNNGALPVSPQCDKGNDPSEAEGVCDVYVQRNVLKEKEVKSLYRQLAKRCHPDTSNLTGAEELFSEVQHAYTRQDLCHLILLEQAILDTQNYRQESPVAKLERLEKKYHMACREKEKLLLEKQKLKASHSYKLWQEVFRQKALGNDLVREIKAGVMQELRLKKDFLASRHSALV